MLATSAFGLGIDYGYVKFVLLYGLPYSFEDYIQMSGRGGRNGSDSFSILFLNSHIEQRNILKSRNTIPINSQQFQNSEFMLKYANNTLTCRRKIISSYFDGKEIGCNQVSLCNPCDICQKNSKTIDNNSLLVDNDNLVAQSNIVQLNLNAKNMFVLQLKTMLNLLKSNCRLCFVINNNLLDHNISHCPNLQGRCLKCFSKNHIANRCNVITIHPSQFCSQCLLPDYFQDECFHEDQFGNGCYKSVLREFGMAIFHFKGNLTPETTISSHYKWLLMISNDFINNASILLVGFGSTLNLV